MQEAKLNSIDKEASDYFGYSVAIDSTGTRVIVGAYAEDSGGLTNAGSAYIFTRSGTTWAQEAKLNSIDKQANDQFGYSVAIDSTGTRVIVGANTEAPSGILNAGSVYLFVRSGTIWTQEVKLDSIDKEANDLFGASVSIDSSGTRVVIGAHAEDPNNLNAAGSAYIFS